MDIGDILESRTDGFMAVIAAEVPTPHDKIILTSFEFVWGHFCISYAFRGREGFENDPEPYGSILS